MSLGYERIKIAVEENGKKMYVSGAEIKDDKVEYRLTEGEAQVYPNSEATVLLPMLRNQEPEKDFIVEGIDSAEE